MQIESKEKTLTGIPAIAALVGLVVAVVLYNSLFGTNPETDAELQALLREDIQRYLVTSGVLASTTSGKDQLAKSASMANAQMVRTSMNKLRKPQILNMELDRKKFNAFCGSDRQYHVRVRYIAEQEQSLNLRYCFSGRKQWLRSTSFHVK